ncbi:MAG: DegT/DnrJ/EryC1/StrS family aminotransferase [Alphaproteobacteria bacterium]|nr:DegT/DnrJ/EryC1/StrS family aminotransferase [Alphaproteobacteria bacterium]
MSDPITLAPWPHYAEDEVAAAAAVLRSGKVNYRTGPLGREFEAAYARSLGLGHGLAVANGTVALELAVLGLGLGPGDEVIVPARTFIATAAAVVRAGARPVVADIDRLSHNLTAETVERVMTPATKAVIPVHLGGWPVDMAPLMALARARNVKVIEDCAQSHGATTRGQPTGAIGDVGCFSFCQDKIISTGGEGGMVVTGDGPVHKRMWAFREHGWDYDSAHQPDPNDGFRWLAADFGSNGRMTESQAAIGLAQLAKLSAWVGRRRANAALLSERLRNLSGVTVLDPPADVGHAYYKYAFMIEPAALKASWTRNRVLSELDARGVPARVGACPDISRERAFSDRGFAPPQPLPNAAWVDERSALLPVHPTLTGDQLGVMADAVRAVMAAAVR